MERGLVARMPQPFAIFVICVLEYVITKIVRRPERAFFFGRWSPARGDVNVYGEKEGQEGVSRLPS